MRTRVASVLVLVLVGVRVASAQTFALDRPPSNESLFAKLRFDLPVEPVPVVQTAPPRQMAFEYSYAYRTRAKIHRYASFATLPLFALEGVVGQSLYNNPTDGKKSAHLAIATTMGALFAVNSVTGVWNMVEARKDPNGRKRRLLHGILMLAADAGFLATAMTGPENEADEGGGQSEGGSRSRHRAIAFTSIGMATASYLIMLFGR